MLQKLSKTYSLFRVNQIFLLLFQTFGLHQNKLTQDSILLRILVRRQDRIYYEGTAPQSEMLFSLEIHYLRPEKKLIFVNVKIGKCQGPGPCKSYPACNFLVKSY